MTARTLPPRLGRLARAVTAGRPPLTDAACIGQWALFDAAGTEPTIEPAEAVADRHARAAALCRACPELTACREWHSSTPPRMRAAGVVAGIIPNPSAGRGRPRKEDIASQSRVE